MKGRIIWLIVAAAVILPQTGYSAGSTGITSYSNKSQHHQVGRIRSNRMSIGGGYYLPDIPPNKELASVGSHISGGLDCSGLDWTAQLKNSLNMDLAQKQLAQLKSSAIAGSVKYIKNMMMPTWAQTLQQALQDAQAQVGSLKADCNSIAQQLSKSDPLNLAVLQQKANTIKKNDKKGVTFGKSVKDIATKGLDWSLYKSVDKSKMSDRSKQTVKAFMGNVTFKAGGSGEQSKTYEMLNPDQISSAFLNTQDAIKKNLMGRMTAQGKEACTDRMFSSLFEEGGLSGAAKARGMKKGSSSASGGSGATSQSSSGSLSSSTTTNGDSTTVTQTTGGTGSGNNGSKSSAKLTPADQVLADLLQASGSHAAKIALLSEFEIYKLNPNVVECSNLIRIAGFDNDAASASLDYVAQNLTLRGMEQVVSRLNFELEKFKAASGQPDLVKIATQTRDMAKIQIAAIKDNVKRSSEQNAAIIRASHRQRQLQAQSAAKIAAMHRAARNAIQ